MASNKDSFGRTLFVVVGLCLICSVLVSTAAVVLKPIQQENKLLDKQKYILEAASLINPKEGKITKKDILSKYEQYVDARLVDLKTGEFVEGDANLYDQRKASRDTETTSIPENDVASIKRVADKAVVYLVRNDEGKLTSVILPVHG
ncbi:Na(+)-translocating NADH-quinone reductase subunit C, partial [Shewanella sp. SR41-2]|nr:Na(+)-translocating NADH-quinone reductase subunit C [Shewanella sp. SR41-2]